MSPSGGRRTSSLGQKSIISLIVAAILSQSSLGGAHAIRPSIGEWAFIQDGSPSINRSPSAILDRKPFIKIRPKTRLGSSGCLTWLSRGQRWRPPVGPRGWLGDTKDNEHPISYAGVRHLVGRRFSIWCHVTPSLSTVTWCRRIVGVVEGTDRINGWPLGANN
ncbi:hypothetical protein LSH36_365g02032 [Paralvinella palmiformis]|uniref:Uncharacterized protein n=1 Tax=Paralvinella palmiformis TaxID=53620 RepID=A0AAD9JEE2_9ANNE|nr:hypothetical protein LSH36_365g02032 [Paralvinella palmiformis]